MTILDIAAQADTLIIEAAIETPPPAKDTLVDYFINGGAGYISILTLFLIGIFIAAWKAPAWIRGIGLGALIASLIFTLIGSYQIFGLIQQWSGIPFGVVCGGLRCICIPLIYGLFIYLISILISTFQKPRI